jgi:excisionase family DNA binding protein
MPDTATSLTLGQAARLTGLGKTTLARAIKAGRLSATRGETGGYSIDAAELARVFPFPSPAETGVATAPVVHHATVDDQVAGLREMLAMLRAEHADLRQDRDQWREMAQRLALAPPKPSPAPAETPAPVDAVEAAAIPALRDTVAALKAALDAEQARNRELRRARDAGGPLYRALRWMRSAG